MYKKNLFKPTIQKTVEDVSSPEESSFEDTDERKRIEGTKRMRNARYIKVEKIQPDPNQPRKSFPDKTLKELADSIQSHGILQPIVVEYIEEDNYYKIISGERRFHAAKLANLTMLPCIVHENVDINNRYAKQLIENIQREDLSPIDKARALLEYKEMLGPESIWDDVEKMVGISKTRRKQFIALLNLPDEIQKEIVTIGRRPMKNIITEKHARALLILKHDSEKQKELFDRIKNSGEPITGDEAIRLAKHSLSDTKVPEHVDETKKEISIEYIEALLLLNNHPDKQRELLNLILENREPVSGDEINNYAKKIRDENHVRVYRVKYENETELTENLIELIQVVEDEIAVLTK